MTKPREVPAATLPNGAAMPMVGFGTWQLRGESAYKAIRYALESGYRHIDTATIYGNESEVGRAVHDSGVPRDEVFITTKLPPEQADRARETIDRSLKDLRTDYVDMWLIHWPPSRIKESWQAMRAIRDAGLTRAIGVSNYSIAQIDTLTADSGEQPPVNQIRWSPAEHEPRRVAEHRERGIVLEGYSGLKGVNLRGPVLTSIAAAHGRTVAQVVLRWHLEHDIMVIPKSARQARIVENIDLFDFELTPDEVARIDALSI